jgi:lipid-A-disaccharide synthase-like uncharacterized protein
MRRPDTERQRIAIAALLALALIALAAATAATAATAPALIAAAEPAAAQQTHRLPLKVLPAGAETVSLVPTAGGGYAYEVLWQDGRRERMSPDEFAELLYTGHSGRNRLFAFLNITSHIGIAWVGLGLFGQVLFTGRMLVQWIVSERERRSVVPVAFWWMSLAGATMLVIYFVWRRDAVGVLGQATGWFIYVRNLRLIYRSPRAELPASLG